MSGRKMKWNGIEFTLPEGAHVTEPGERLAGTVVLFGLPEPVTEHLFHPTRRWRFDLAWPEYKVAVERDGGISMPKGVMGRHVTPEGYANDKDKLNEAQILGWVVLAFTPSMLRGAQLPRSIDVIRRALASRGHRPA